MKILTANAAMIPSAWRKVVNTKTHHSQGDVVIVAASKAAAVEMLISGGAGRVEAEAIVRCARVAIATTNVMSLMDAGVLDLKESKILAFRTSQSGNPIARVDLPDLPVVAHFRYRNNSEAVLTGKPDGLYVEAAK